MVAVKLDLLVKVRGAGPPAFAFHHNVNAN